MSVVAHESGDFRDLADALDRAAGQR